MFRIGQSTDIHRFEKGRRLVLGGVEIEHDQGLLGHSDADCLLHAVSEAILGALALGDLGSHFPDTDPKYKGADSLMLLREVVRMMKDKQFQIGNIDALILIEKPKMAPHIEKMRKNIADACECEMDQVSVKATRGEKLGFIGHEEGAAATAVVLLEKKEG